LIDFGRVRGGRCQDEKAISGDHEVVEEAQPGSGDPLVVSHIPSRGRLTAAEQSQAIAAELDQFGADDGCTTFIQSVKVGGCVLFDALPEIREEGGKRRPGRGNGQEHSK
jgi:hypothetical protein